MYGLRLKHRKTKTTDLLRGLKFTDMSISLQSADRIEIISVIDNYVDVLLGSNDIVSRPPLSKGKELPTDTLVAEHGLSLLITVYSGEEKHTILFDTGYNSFSVLHNLDQLGKNLDEIESIVLSHGHMDHTGSLHKILNKITKPISLVLHPQAFQPSRYIGQEDGVKLAFPQTLRKSRLEEYGVEILESRSAVPIAGEMILVTGEVERVTPFEKGLPNIS